jgi:hypothetical protein
MDMRLKEGIVSIKRGELNNNNWCSYWNVINTTANVQPNVNNINDFDEVLGINIVIMCSLSLFFVLLSISIVDSKNTLTNIRRLYKSISQFQQTIMAWSQKRLAFHARHWRWYEGRKRKSERKKKRRNELSY